MQLKQPQWVPMDNFYWILTSSIFLTDLAIRIGLSLRVIMRKKAASVSLAWLVVILLLPLAGAIVYLLFGENRIGERRARRAAADVPLIRQWSDALQDRINVNWERINPECRPLDRQIVTALGIPTMPDNDLALIEHSDAFFHSLLHDIREAKSSCYFEFYIWSEGGLADSVARELIVAQKRGVQCRVLLDSIGSKEFLRSRIVRDMRKAGVEVVESLPAGLIRALFVRIDLRNHRKIITIDGTIGYTGSQNLVDPRFFKQDQGVGEWVDTMVRITGPVVEIMTTAFMYDWLLEKDHGLDSFMAESDIKPIQPAGNALVQLAPSGPGMGEGTIHDLLLTTIYAARKELILTTPYFVPDNAILAALKSAAQRGVKITIIVPDKNDSKLVHYASRARYDDLTAAGINILAFTGGLLHAKTITVDSNFCLFGSVNLDMRSFWLNFEMTLFVYEEEFTCRVKEIQLGYMKEARSIDCEDFTSRSFKERFLENTAHLVGPLL